jgi:hypothetical protein
LANLNNRKATFITLGKFLSQFSKQCISKKDDIPHNDLFFDALKMQINRSIEFNGWFNKENVLFALESWTEALQEDNIEKWLKPYNINIQKPKTIAVIMAGNIPLVGFHDFLSVLISGHKIMIKQSSNDKHLLPILAKYLEKINPNFKDKIVFSDGRLTGFDAVIATGSDNSAKYFDYYFGKHPHIIRQNRNGVAVLTGKESAAELKALGEDIFRYFGLGCRNVAKLFVPQDYNFDTLFKALYDYNYLLDNNKYTNNYDYNKAVYLMSLYDLLENGFLMLKEDPSYTSPIATLFFEKYTDLGALEEKLALEKDKIQVIVSNGSIKNSIPFGETQKPKLWDYADGVDTLAFLLKQ